MTHKIMNALVFFLAVLLTTIPAWSSTPDHINPADSGKSLSTDMNPVAEYTFKTEIILARGGNGGGGNGGGNGGNGGQGGNGGGNGGNGGQGGNGNGNGNNGGNGNGDLDGDGPHGPNGNVDAPGSGYGPGPDAGPGTCDGGLL